MDIQTKKMITIAIGVIGGLILGLFVLQNIWAILTAAIGGVIGGLIAAYLIKGPESIEDVKRTIQATVGKPMQSQTDPVYVLNLALKFNQLVRTSEGVSIEILARVEQIIDKVEVLVPTLCADYRSDDLTYGVCRVATYQLPRLLNPYLNVGVGDRKAVESNVQKALDAMLRDITEIEEIFRNQGIEAARHRAKTVETKFAGIGGEAAATA